MRPSPRVRVFNQVLFSLFLIAGASGLAPAEDQAEPGTATAATELSVDARFATAVQRSREAFAGELSRLTELFAASATPAEALAVQRQITLLKQDAEIAVLEIQLGFAREAGRIEQAAELEAWIEQARAALLEAPAGAGR